MKNKDKIPQKSKQLKTFARFSGLGLQMGVTIFLAAKLGNWLDEKYPSEKKWFTLSCVLLAFVLSLYSLVRQLNRHNEESDK